MVTFLLGFISSGGRRTQGTLSGRLLFLCSAHQAGGDSLIEGVFGGKKKNRCRFRGLERIDYAQTSNSSSTTPESSQRPEPTIQEGTQEVNTTLTEILDRMKKSDKKYDLLFACMPPEMQNKYQRLCAELVRFSINLMFAL